MYMYIHIDVQTRGLRLRVCGLGLVVSGVSQHGWGAFRDPGALNG